MLIAVFNLTFWLQSLDASNLTLEFDITPLIKMQSHNPSSQQQAILNLVQLVWHPSNLEPPNSAFDFYSRQMYINGRLWLVELRVSTRGLWLWIGFILVYRRTQDWDDHQWDTVNIESLLGIVSQ